MHAQQNSESFECLPRPPSGPTGMQMAHSKTLRRVAGILGLSAVLLLGCALVVFSLLNPEFHPLRDYVSKLGAVGQPFALWWNLTGFVAVGLLILGFGIAYGRFLGDRQVGLLLALFGVGFAATGVPVDLGDEGAGISKAHVVAICLGLAAYMLCLARMAHLPSFAKPVRNSANVAATLLGLSIAGQILQLWSMAVTHRLVFVVVFGWLAVTSIRLLGGRRSLAGTA